MTLGFPRAKQGLCHYDIWGGDPLLIRYSSKTAEQNFIKLSGIVHYTMTYCTFYFKFLSAWFWGFPEQNKDFAIQNMGERGVSLQNESVHMYTFPYSCIFFRAMRVTSAQLFFLILGNSEEYCYKGCHEGTECATTDRDLVHCTGEWVILP